MPNNKKKKTQKGKKNGEGKTSTEAKSHNEANQSVHDSIARIAESLKELDDSGTTARSKANEETVSEVPSLRLAKGDKDFFQIVEGGENTAIGIFYEPTVPQVVFPLHHWRLFHDLDHCNDVNEAYKMIIEGTAYLKATSTKYTLMGKASPDGDFGGLAEEVLKSAQIISAGVMVLHNDNVGCGRGCRSYAKRGVRRLFSSILALTESFLDASAWNENVGAVKTGALWESCDALLKLPKGNRNAIRREMLLWAKDAAETIEEFQQLIDLGPLQSSSKVAEDEDLAGWDEFCEGNDGEQYTESEVPIAKACLGIIKCSRATLGLILEACDIAGDLKAVSSEHDINNTIPAPPSVKESLIWVGQISEVAREIGDGVTDLGMLLYPPIDVGNAEFRGQLQKGMNAILLANDMILDVASESSITPFLSLSTGSKLNLPAEMTAKAGKLRSVALERYDEVVSELK
jgi:hypothetical protein